MYPLKLYFGYRYTRSSRRVGKESKWARSVGVFRLATAVRKVSTRSSTGPFGGLRLELLLIAGGQGHLAVLS